MALSDVTVANYCTFKIDDVEITDVESLSGGAVNTNIIEFKQYNQSFTRKITGSSSTDAYELVCTWIPSTPSYQALESALNGGTKSEFTLIFLDSKNGTTGVQHTFNGIVASKSVSNEYDTQRTVTYSIAVDGGVTESDVT